MTVRESTVTLPDGRTLAVAEAGDLVGRAVFTLHGTPGSRLIYDKHAADARAKGLRLIGYDRPGYGSSTVRRGRSVAEVAADVRAIADALGVDRFGVWGHSGGGGPALACAALLPDRVVGAVSLATTAPPTATGFDPTEGMGEANVEDLRLLRSDPAAWERKVEVDAADFAHATPEQTMELLSSLLSPLDRGALSPELGAFLSRQVQVGLAPGGAGMRDDNLADLKPWGFEVEAIEVPVQVWHGRHDRFVGFSHGQWLAAHVGGAESHLEPEEGHLSLYERRIPEVHRWIRERFLGPRGADVRARQTVNCAEIWT
jgi:pimeloyl-ACP methyl ester carboxylesterase